MSDGRNGLSATSITAAAAVVAALIALSVGVWENVQERRHNRLSVFPHLALIAEVHTTDAPDSVDSALIRLVNEGVGPALVDDFLIEVQEPSGEFRTYESWVDAAGTLERRYPIELAGHVEIGDGLVVGVGRDLDLVTFRALEPQGEGGQTAFLELLDDLRLRIDYHSIYEETYVGTFGDG